MPTYQYACTECGDSFEQFQSFTDDTLTECPTCGGRLRKVFSSVGIVFKGSGFYRTDSRDAATSKEPAPAAAKSGSGTSDKPATKAPADAKPAGAEKTSSTSGGSSSASGGSGSSTTGSAA